MRACPKCPRTYPDDVDYCPRDATPLISTLTATPAELESSLVARQPRVAFWAGVAMLALVPGLGGWYVSWRTHPTAISPPNEIKATKARRNPKDGLNYVRIPPGNFMMGCSPGDSECSKDEKPSHQVTISKGFWLGQTLVTVAAYRRYSEATGRAMPAAPNFNLDWNNQEMPIVNASWDDSIAYCDWAGGRLPTEAEWEYAARAGSTEVRYGPIDDVAWYSSDSGGKTHEVSKKRANGFKLYDMLGNVWEWVNDWYGKTYYAHSPARDPQGPSTGQWRVFRGGSWYNVSRLVRASIRSRLNPGFRNDHLGFRCVWEVDSGVK
jgi:formylglycine-generating enzyme required for sulfatase activity